MRVGFTLSIFYTSFSASIEGAVNSVSLKDQKLQR